MSTMEKIRIITDTASDLTAKEALDYGITMIPFDITIKDKAYKEEYELPKEEFYAILNECDELPVSAQITAKVFLNTYETLYKEGYTHLIVVPINAAGSGTHDNAMLAREKFYNRHPDKTIIEIIDACTYTYAYGRPVMLAAEQIKEGCGFDKAVRFLKNRLSHSHCLAYMSTLKYAKLSGRISVLTAIVGEVLGLKPIIEAGNRTVITIDKARGEKAAITNIIERIKRDAIALENEEIFIVYGDIPQETVDRVKSQIIDKLSPKSIFEGRLGCAIAINTGPQTLAIGYQGRDYHLYEAE